MAVAYAFHICRNHPILDGNKRTALASALVFLDMNGENISCDSDKLYEAMMELAAGKLSKSAFAYILRSK
jgi:death-on-curing protein